MHVVGGIGWAQGLLRNPLPSYPEAAEMGAEAGIGPTPYTDYDQRITDRAVEWLAANAGGERAFAAFVSLIAPHYPLSVPEEFFAPYRDLPANTPGIKPDISPQEITHPAVAAMADFFAYHRAMDTPTADLARRAYFGLCTWLDHNVSRILAALEASGATDDTLVIYTSDHGDMHGNRGLWAKSYMYEDSVRIPMIIAGPGVPMSAVVDTPVSHIDIDPTVHQVMCGGSGGAESLVDVAHNPRAERLGFSEYHDGGSITGSYAVQLGLWKYIHHVGYRPELYDLDDDPDELVDLGESAAHAQVRNDCLDALRSIVDPQAANDAASASQAALIDKLGAPAKLSTQFRINHTPAPAG